VVFVQAHLAVPLPIATAVERLRHALAHEQLGAASDGAYAQGLSVLARVGPLGPQVGLSKQVRLQVLEPRPVGEGMRVPLRWVATGVSGRLFPALDADLDLTGQADESSLLTVNASYTPPLGAVGSGVDRLVLRHAARATMGVLLGGVADVLVVGAAGQGSGFPVPTFQVQFLPD